MSREHFCHLVWCFHIHPALLLFQMSGGPSCHPSTLISGPPSPAGEWRTHSLPSCTHLQPIQLHCLSLVFLHPLSGPHHNQLNGWSLARVLRLGRRNGDGASLS